MENTTNQTIEDDEARARRRADFDADVAAAGKMHMTSLVILTPDRDHHMYVDEIPNKHSVTSLVRAVIRGACWGPLVGASRQDPGCPPETLVLTNDLDAERLVTAWNACEFGTAELMHYTADKDRFAEALLFVFDTFRDYDAWLRLVAAGVINVPQRAA